MFPNSHDKPLLCDPGQYVELVNSPFWLLLLDVVSLSQLFLSSHWFPFMQAFITLHL